MFDTPYVMKLAHEAARHAGARQSQIAKNIANADTPGYRARDLAAFSETYQRAGGPSEVKLTRAGHISSEAISGTYKTYDAGGAQSPNGNNVSVEVEMARGTDAKGAHDMALTIYKSSLDILRASLGRGGVKSWTDYTKAKEFPHLACRSRPTACGFCRKTSQMRIRRDTGAS